MRIVVALLLLLTACSDDTQAPVTAPVNPWVFQYSPGMTAPSLYGGTGFRFTFPATDGVHYLVKPQVGSLSHSISVSYAIDVSPDAVFDYRTNPNNTCGPGFPGHTMPYFHKANDPQMTDEFGRWFAWGYKKDLIGGSFGIDAVFSDPAKWISVYGKNGADYPVQFQAALGSIAEVGMVFGGGCFAGHGVFVTGGTATMTATAFIAN